MAFDVGSIIGHAKLDTTNWESGEKKLGNSFGKIKAGIAAVGIAIGGALIASIKTANDFNKEFSNVKTLISDTSVNTNLMKKELLGLDARLGSSKDLAKGLYQALSAGVDAGNAVKFVGESAKFAKAALTDTNTAVDVITTALNAYKLSANQAGKVSDIFFETVKQGKTTGQELASTIGQVIPVAAQLNIGLDELGASIATMTKQGINSSEATTQLNAIMTAFLKPSKEMSAALKDIGYESGSALIESEGLSGALKFLQESTEGNKDELAKLLPNVRAFRGAMALTGTQADEYNKTLLKMQESAGATDEAFKKQELTFETLRNSIEKISIRIGNALLPLIYDLTNQITNFINNASKMDDVSTAIAIAASSFAVLGDIIKALIVPIKDIFLGIIDALNNSFSKLSKASGDTSIVFTIMSGAIKTLVIPFKILGKIIEGLIIEIGDLITAIINSGKTVNSFFKFLTGKASWDEVKKNAKSAGEAFKDIGKNLIGSYGEIFETIKDEISGLPDETNKMSDKMSNSWKDVFAKVKKNISGAMVDIKSDIKSDIEDIIDDTEKGGKELKKDWSKIMSDFGEGFKNGLESAQGYFNYFADFLSEGFSAISETVTMFLDNKLATIEAEGQAELEILQINKDTELMAETEKHNQELLLLQNKLLQGQISEEQYNLQKDLLIEKHDKKREELEAKHKKIIDDQNQKQTKKENEQKKKAFETQKAFDITSVWLSFASGTMAAWAGAFAALGGIPIVGPALAMAMAGVMTGILLGTAIAQTVLISQQSFTPAAATGGVVTSSGMIRTDEAGGEIKKYNKGDLIIPNDISQQISRNVGNGNSKEIYNISFAGANITNDMSLKKVTDYVIKEIGKRKRFA